MQSLDAMVWFVHKIESYPVVINNVCGKGTGCSENRSVWRNWIARGTSNPKVAGSIPVTDLVGRVNAPIV